MRKWMRKMRNARGVDRLRHLEILYWVLLLNIAISARFYWMGTPLFVWLGKLFSSLAIAMIIAVICFLVYTPDEYWKEEQDTDRTK